MANGYNNYTTTKSTDIHDEFAERKSSLFIRVESQFLSPEREYYHEYESGIFGPQVAAVGRTKDGKINEGGGELGA